MEYELHWGGDPEDLLVIGSGVEAADELGPLQEALADERWRPPMRVLLDFRRVDLSQMTAAEARQRVELFVRSGERIGRCHTAVVVGRDIDFGMARMQQALSERQVPYEVGVFRSLEEARHWLREAGD
jgi:hypothetical protein